MIWKFEQASVIGAGVIGASWSALFLAAGLQVDVYEPAKNGEAKVRAYIENAWPTLEKLGLTQNGNPDAIVFHDSAES